MRVLVVLASSPNLGDAVRTRDASVLASLPVTDVPSFELDLEFPPVEIPASPTGQHAAARSTPRPGALVTSCAGRSPAMIRPRTPP